MTKYRQMGLLERAKQLKSAIEDFKSIEGFSRKVIKKYEDQLKEVDAEIERLKQKNKTVGKTIEEITTEFFKRRFPDKNLQFEKDCGYFGEWVERFKSGHPEGHMDPQSLRVWEEMQKEGFKWK